MSDTYINKSNGEKVRIVSDVGNFYTLNNNLKVAKDIFKNRYVLLQDNDTASNTVSQSVDANDFLSQQTNITREQPKTQEQQPQQIQENKQVDQYIASDNSVMDADAFLNSSSIQMGSATNMSENAMEGASNTTTEIVRVDNNSSLDDIKAEMLKKHNIQQSQQETQPQQTQKVLNENGLTEGQERLRDEQIRLGQPDPFKDKVAKYKASRQSNVSNTNNDITLNDTVLNKPVVTPSNDLFKKFKKNYDINIKLNIDDKISKPDFIKIMADGLEGDIIQYYTDRVFEKFITDMVSIKENIYEQIHLEVYDELPEKKPAQKLKDKSNLKQVQETVDGVNLYLGKVTKSGKQTYKYINNSGKTVEMLPSTAKKKKYKPYNED